MKNNTNNQFPFLQVLTLIFITFKVLEIIDWSWWIVLAPLYLPVAVASLILAIALGVDAILKIKE